VLPGEMVILMAIAKAGEFGKKLLPCPAGVAGEYIGDLYASLIRRGYLQSNNSREYQLTSQGKGVLIKFLQENKTRGIDTLSTLQQLRIDTSGVIDELEKEAIDVR